MDEEATLFLREKEERIGKRIIYKTFCPWYARLAGERREWGVFLYSEGENIYFEDFDRQPSILGFKIPVKNREKYVKMEVSFPLSDIASLSQVTRTSAAKSLKNNADMTKIAGLADKALKKLVTKVKLENGEILFFEMMSYNEFLNFVRGNNERV